MRAEIIDFTALTARERAAWNDLADRACVPNPFSEPDFVEAAIRGFDVRNVGVLAVTDARGWLAAMPVIRVRRWRRVPGPLLVCWRHPYCYLTTPLLEDENSEAVLEALLLRGAAERGVLGLMLDWIDLDGLVGAALAAAADRIRRPLQIEAFARASLQRRPENDYLSLSASPRHRKETRRLRNRLEEEVGALELHDRAGAGDAVARFLELERSGWKGRAGTAMASNVRHGEFFAELCERYATAGRLQLLSLEHEGRPVAMKCNLVAGEGIFCFKIAFDERLARFSPGIHLEVANVGHFHEQSSATWMDSCAAPDNAMINRLWPDRRALQSLLICPTRLRGAIGSGLWYAARSAQAIAHSKRKNDDAAGHR